MPKSTIRTYLYQTADIHSYLTSKIAFNTEFALNDFSQPVKLRIRKVSNLC